jgi:hypothetical protein
VVGDSLELRWPFAAELRTETYVYVVFRQFAQVATYADRAQPT